MELFYRKTGSGKPLIILHGLFGSSDNWHSIGKQLSVSHEVFLVDQRNHGQSPHHSAHNYIAMSDDLHEFIVQHNIFRPVIMGHSMGGRTAMFFSVRHPKLIDKLIVSDISPCSYNPENHPDEALQHEKIIAALHTIDLSVISSRHEADIKLAETINSPSLRQFLLKNIKTDNKGKFQWKLNINAIENNLSEIYKGIEILKLPGKDTLKFPALFIRGEYSGYIKEKDVACIHNYFSNASIITIPQAGHWLHAEKPALFIKAVEEFLK
jgi:pimeloyl-ACP methyl ester carboxylesterase